MSQSFAYIAFENKEILLIVFFIASGLKIVVMFITFFIGFIYVDPLLMTLLYRRMTDDSYVDIRYQYLHYYESRLRTLWQWACSVLTTILYGAWSGAEISVTFISGIVELMARSGKSCFIRWLYYIRSLWLFLAHGDCNTDV